MIGKTLGKYQIISELGKIVYLAEHTAGIGRKFVIKRLSPVEHDSHFHESFYREAKNQALLNHPNIVPITDFFEKDGQFFVVMEYVEGQSLSKLIKAQGRLEEQDALSILKDVLMGLGYAHSKGLIHADIKPSNIIIGKSGTARITDFAFVSCLLAEGRLILTGTRAARSPWYMSPEQITRPGQLDPRTDIYSLGIVLYEMLAGDVPFNGETDFSIQKQQIQSPPPNLHHEDPAISEKLAYIVIKAMAKDADERFPGWFAFLWAIDAIDKPALAADYAPKRKRIFTSRPRIFTSRRRHTPIPEEVHLGTAAPRSVSPGEEFVARFAAYRKTHRNEVWQVITEEAPSAQPRLDLETCRWHRGTKVTVRLDAHYVELPNPIQTFEWNGAWCVLRFDAKLPVDIEVNTIILRFDIAVEGLPIIALRPEIAVSRKAKEKETARSVLLIEQSAPTSAFASYAKKDRRDVLGRVRSLQIFTGIDVFLDCLSIRPGEAWKLKLKKEIHDRDVFWLFWSRSAMASEWVEWEWRTALAEKPLAKIQPHPLEPSELAPPPQELSSLQFGAMYEWYVSQLRESAITRLFRPLLHKAVSFMSRR